MTTRLQSQPGDFAETKRKVYIGDCLVRTSMFIRCLQLQVFPQEQDTLFLNSYNVYRSRQKKDRDGYRNNVSSFEKWTEKTVGKESSSAPPFSSEWHIEGTSRHMGWHAAAGQWLLKHRAGNYRAETLSIGISTRPFSAAQHSWEGSQFGNRPWLQLMLTLISFSFQ